jgi:enoyl-CoA hydratase/carnithine racemase
VLGRNAKGRILARARTGHRATLAALAKDDPIGKSVRIAHRGDANYLEAANRIGEKSSGFPARQFSFVTLKRDGHVLEVTLNRPESLNSLHSAAHFELHEIWGAFEADSDLWVAIVTGAGDRAFSSGNDLKATAKGADMSTPHTGFAGLCSRFDREKPIIAAVNGIAMGGGMEIVLACDLAVADESGKFALPEVKVGLFAAAGGVQRLSRQIGRKSAMELILTGRRIGAVEAKALGIVNSVVPAGTALAEARKFAQKLLESSPSSIRASKQALNELERIEDLKAAMEANGPIFGRLMRTRDFREGVTAFAEKRKPNWSNS